jgi:hypothetical protein
LQRKRCEMRGMNGKHSLDLAADCAAVAGRRGRKRICVDLLHTRVRVRALRLHDGASW